MWNVYYDGVLKVGLPEGLTMYAYTDYLALIISSKNADSLKGKANTGINRVHRWLRTKGLELAQEKTKAPQKGSTTKLRSKQQPNSNIGIY